MPPAEARQRRIARQIERWFAVNQRDLPWRRTYDPYLVWVSEVMLQQTRMEVVLGYFERFVGRFPTVESLAGASEDDVVAAWSGLGYYRRARMLRDGATAVVTRFGGTIPEDLPELQTIPGIGRYTAGAIASIAFQKRVPIVDGNVARILARVEAIEHPLGSPRLMAEAWQRAENLVAASVRPRLFNQGLMELGALVCKPRQPACEICPLRAHCFAYASGRTGELPMPKAKPQTTSMRIPLYLISDGRGRLLMRREEGRLMKSLFHLPHGNSSLLTGTPLSVITTSTLGTFRHTVTTRRIEFEVFAAELADWRVVRDSGEEYSWINPADLVRLPHASYVAKALLLIAGVTEARESPLM